MIVPVLVLLLCIASIPLFQGFEFSKDGSIEQLQFAQQAVNKNGNEASLFSIKYRTGTIMFNVCKQKKSNSILGTRTLTGDNMYENKHLRAILVGEKSDSQQARHLCAELDRKYHTANGSPITASMLTLSLADIAQRCSVSSGEGRLLAFNALVVNIDARPNSKFGELFKVDVSGNFFRCNSVCIGARSEQIRSWLGDRGQLLHSQLLDAHASKSTAPNTSPLSDRQAEAVTGGLFNISTSCLLENYPLDELAAGKYSLSVTLLQDSQGGERSVVG